MSNYTVAIKPLAIGFIAEITADGVVLSHTAATRSTAAQWVGEQLQLLEEDA